MKSSYISFPIIGILAVTTFALANLPPDVVKKITGHLETCSKKYGTSKDDAIKLLAELKIPETQEMKCTFDCYFILVGYLKNGKFDWDEVIASHDEEYPTDPVGREKANKVAEACRDIVNVEGLKECEFSPVVLACNYEYIKKFFGR